MIFFWGGGAPIWLNLCISTLSTLNLSDFRGALSFVQRQEQVPRFHQMLAGSREGVHPDLAIV